MTNALIGVTLEVQPVPGKPVRYGHHTAYFAALERVGLTPVGIPPLKPARLRTIYERLDGLVLSGGTDIAPHRYGEEARFPLEEPNDSQDEAEITLTRWCLQDQKPLLGICRGLQLLNVALGGTLYQDLRSQTGTDIDHQLSEPVGKRTRSAHVLKLGDTSWLTQGIGRNTVGTNTMHHQGIKSLGDGLEAFGWAPDGLAEAVRVPDHRFAVAFQGHLEELIQSEPWVLWVYQQFAKAVNDQ